MTPEEKAFEREVREQLKGRARIVRDTEGEIRSLLAEALAKIIGVLAGQPSGYQLWSLPRLIQEIGAVATELGDAATAAAAQAANATWAAGTQLVAAPMAAAGLRTLSGNAPQISTRQLTAMQHFLADRMEDVSLQAANKINGQLGLVVIGAQTPHEAQVAIRKILKGSSASRAATIVRTELLRVYSTASAAAMEAAAADGVPMDKVWRRSSKAHPRVSHALTDGQRRPHDKPYLLGVRVVSDPPPAGGVWMAHPHDPKAPPAETINCGCVSIPKPRNFTPTVPDHKPFTAEELARNPTLKTMLEEGVSLAGKARLERAVQYVGDVTADPRTKRKPEVLAPVSAEAADRAAALGVALGGKQVALDHDGVLHVLKKHGGANEEKRGQVPITASDLAIFDRLVNAATFRRGDPPTARDGTPLMEGSAIDGDFAYGFVVRIRRAHVVPQTLWKRNLK